MTMRISVTVVGLALLIPTTTCAQGYPDRPLRIILPSAPGGLPDIQARLMAAELGKQMAQTVAVDNRPGGSFIIGFDLMAKATPDGYTVGYASFPIATNPSLFAKLPYYFDRDFRPVMHQVSALNILAVSPSLPIASAQDLIAHAKANPDKLSYGISGFGASNHLSIELIKMMTGARLVAVSYKAIQQAITEAATGQIHVVCDNMGSILPHVKAGRMRGLGVTSPKRSPVMPDLPTVAEQGLPGYEIMPWSGYVLPKRLPEIVIASTPSSTRPSFPRRLGVGSDRQHPVGERRGSSGARAQGNREVGAGDQGSRHPGELTGIELRAEVCQHPASATGQEPRPSDPR
jgi:tripartite-type tricarboxylate transporter receptor subunit TctC